MVNKAYVFSSFLGFRSLEETDTVGGRVGGQRCALGNSSMIECFQGRWLTGVC